MAQSATTFLSHNSGYGAIKKMEDIRLSDDKKDNIRQKFMTCFTIATKVQRITDNPNENPTFDNVEELMTLLMGLEEQREDAGDNMCYFLQYEVDYTYDRRFHDEIKDIRDTTDVAVARAISNAKEFLRNIDDIDGTFASHQAGCDTTMENMRYYTQKDGKNKPSAHDNLMRLVHNLTSRYEEMKAAWSRLIQCAIDCNNSTVFHEISEKVWATCESVDAATAEAKEAIHTRKPPR